MPVQKQNTEINSSDALYRQCFKSPELVSVFELDNWNKLVLESINYLNVYTC